MTTIENLRIYNHLTEILNLIGSNAVTGILAPTGYGKSIGIPWVLARTGSKVMVSVPTRASAISLAKTLSLLDTNVKTGYAAEGDIQYNNCLLYTSPSPRD